MVDWSPPSRSSSVVAFQTHSKLIYGYAPRMPVAAAFPSPAWVLFR